MVLTTRDSRKVRVGVAEIFFHLPVGTGDYATD
jgi:hypothetical protein